MDGFVRYILMATIAENDVALSAENLKYPFIYYPSIYLKFEIKEMYL